MATIKPMKTILFAMITGLLVAAAGCSSPTTVAESAGQGRKEVFNANYDAVWRAAVDAAQSGDLYVLHADKYHGYIAARRGIRPETFGENVGIWVRPVSPVQTEVEVVSRQAGPPVLLMRNWEKRILASIEATLSTESNLAPGQRFAIVKEGASR